MKLFSGFSESWRDLVNLVRAMSRFLEPEYKRKLANISLWALGVSLIEMATAGAVVPYVQCLSGECSGTIDGIFGAFGWPLVPGLTVGLLALVTLRLATRTKLNWVAAQFTQQVQQHTVSRLLESYLHMDWSRFREESRTHYFRRCATTAVDAAWASQQCVTLISSLVLLVLLTILMLALYPLASACLALVFLILGVVTQQVLGRMQRQAADDREMALRHWNVAMTEAFESFREIRVYGLERFFLGHIDRSLGSLASANRKLSFTPTIPRVILDFAVLVVLLGVVTAWTAFGRPLGELLPQLVFYAVVARAMLPAMMNLLATRAVMSGAIRNIEIVLDELSNAAAGRREHVGIAAEPAREAGFFLEGVSFRHGPHQPPIIDEMDLGMTHPSWLALAGPSGAGKSTLMELLCGIHQPERGRVRHCWPQHDHHRPSIAYLPQHVALLDESVFVNIVFGFDEGDAGRVWEALRLACIDLAIQALPDTIQTRIGPDGARLSGGERQRIALARALYRRPDLLLLDEATSGVDEPTEWRLLENMKSARPEMSVIYITHRSASLRFADKVLQLRNTRLGAPPAGERP